MLTSTPAPSTAALSSPVEDGHIALPLAGFTLLPPWWMFLLWSDKRCENRAPSVAGRLKGWRGIVAFGASKVTSTDSKIDAAMLVKSVMKEPWFAWNGGQPQPLLVELFAKLGGHVLGCAELIDVRQNGSAPVDKWAEPGQSGLILGRVWEVEPVPCSGGRGVYALGACADCHHIGAIEVKGAPLVCRKCKASTSREHLGRPKLRVIAEYDAAGQRVSSPIPHPSVAP